MIYENKPPNINIKSIIIIILVLKPIIIYLYSFKETHIHTHSNELIILETNPSHDQSNKIQPKNNN